VPAGSFSGSRLAICCGRSGDLPLAYLSGLEIKLSPGKLLRKLLIVLMVMALALWFIRSETNKPVGREGIPVSPIPAGKIIQLDLTHRLAFTHNLQPGITQSPYRHRDNPLYHMVVSEMIRPVKVQRVENERR
jgi:hypothetical protein